MGYACPVCHEPQADGEHLANHLAFSALLGHDDHADWLDEHARDWNNDGPAELADRVTPHAESVDIPELTEDATDQGPPDVAAHDLSAAGHARPPEPTHLTPETQRVLEEARALTEQRNANRESAGESHSGDTPEESHTDKKARGDADDENGK